MNIKKHYPRIWNWWPPFLFTGIVIEKFSPDFRYVRIRLKLRFWNANYVGTQYGGSLFSMTDPFIWSCSSKISVKTIAFGINQP